MARAPRRNPRQPGANGSAPNTGGPTRGRNQAGQFLPSASAPPASGGTPSPAPRPVAPENSHVLSGGRENNRAFDAGAALSEGAQTREAAEARSDADNVLRDLFKKFDGNPEAVGTGSDGTGVAVSGNDAPSANGQPLGAFDPNAALAPETEQAQPVETESTDAELLLEPIIMPGSDPADAGTPLSGTPDTLQDPSLSPNAEDQARHALLRSGFLPSEVDAMSADDLVSRGMQRHEALARDDDAHRRLRIGEAPAPASAAAPSEPAEAGVPGGEVRAMLEPLLEPLGEEGVAAVEKLFGSLVTPLKEELAGLKEISRQASQQRIEGLIADSRKGWAERFPQLQQGKVAGVVRQRMQALVKDPSAMNPGLSDQENSDRIMLSACLSLGLQDKNTPRRQASTQETRRRKTRGTQPVTRTKTDSREDPMSHEERQTGILSKLFSGDISGARDFGLRTANQAR